MSASPFSAPFFSRPNNATLVVVGAVKHADVQRLATKYFGWMPRDKQPPRVAEPPPGPFGFAEANAKRQPNDRHWKARSGIG